MTDNLDYFNSEDFREILNIYEESVKSGHPAYMDADDLADIADYYQYNGRIEEAKAAVDLALSYNPEAVGPLLYKAREAMALKDYETAESYASRIEAIDTLESHFLKGEILISQGLEEEADELYRQYLTEVMPDEQMDYVYDVANIYSEYQLYDKAFEWMARSQGDDSDDFKELMARTLFGLGKYKDSERIFNELIDHDPYSTRYWNGLASAQFMREDYHAAITSSEYAIAIDPKDPEGILAKANSLYNLENFEAALSYYQKYSEMVNDDEFGYLHQGTCLINMAKFEEAIDILKQAEAIAPSDSPYLNEIYQELGFSYSELKQPDTAIYYLDKTDDLECDHINICIIKGHVMLANNKLNEAEAYFKKALHDADNAPRVMLRIIVSLYDNRFTNAVYKLLKNFLRFVDSNWNEGYSYMALCCLELKKEDEFLHYLKMACKKNPKEARLVLNSYFPEDIEPKGYYDYVISQMKDKRS
jgi:tetratricopeptide (TPR) repeat protein